MMVKLTVLLLLFMVVIECATGDYSFLSGECQKDFSVHQLQEKVPAFFAGIQIENGNFMEKAFVGILCCISIKAEKDAMKKDILATMVAEFEANRRNFCQQLKKGQNIWEALESSVGNSIVTAARNVKVNPQTYEEGFRKLTKLKIVSPENQTAIGTFVKHCIAALKIFREFIKIERYTSAASFPDFRRTKRALRLRRRRRDNEKVGVYAALVCFSFGLGTSLSYFLSVNQHFKAVNGISGALNSREEWTLFFIIFSFVVCVGSIWRAFKLWRSDRYY